MALYEGKLVESFIEREIFIDPSFRSDLTDLIEVLDIIKGAIAKGRMRTLLTAIDQSMQKFDVLKLRSKFNRYKNETEIKKV